MVNTRSSPPSKSTPNPSAGKPSPSSTSGVAAASAKIIPSSPINAAVLGHPGHEIYVGNPAQLGAVQAARLPIPKGSRRSERIRSLGFQPAKSPSTKSFVPANSSVRGKKVLSSASESLISVKNKGKAASINYGSTNSGEEEDGLECESSLNGDDSSDEVVVLGADDIDEAEAEDLEDSVEMGKSLEPEVDLVPVSKHSKKRKSPRRASTAVPNVQTKKRATMQSSACSSSRPSKGDSVVRTSAKALNKRKSSDKEPTLLIDLHKETHMRKNGTFVDDRAKRICEDYENRLIEESTTRTLTTAEQNEIYKEIAGVKKQRVYGIGSMSKSYGSDGRTCASCLLENGPKEAELNQLKNELADEKAKVAKLEEIVDREKKNREKIEEKLKRLIERVNDSLGGPSN